MKNIMIALLLALGVTLSAEGAAGTGNDAVVQLLRSVIIEDYVIYDRMQTFAEVMEDLCIRVDESRKPDQRPVNLVVRSKKYAVTKINILRRVEISDCDWNNLPMKGISARIGILSRRFWV